MASHLSNGCKNPAIHDSFVFGYFLCKRKEGQGERGNKA